jgi:hypothetical protein
MGFPDKMMTEGGALLHLVQNGLDVASSDRLVRRAFRTANRWAKGTS